MTHSLAAHLRLRNFDAALLANNAAVLESLVLAAQALIIFNRAKDFRAEKSVPLGLKRPIVDRLRFLNLTVRPGSDHVRRSQADPDSIEILNRGLLFEKFQ
jgi:hypothetical protein